MSYQREYGYGYDRPPRRRRSRFFTCLVVLTVFVFILLALGVAALVFVRPQASDLAGRRIGSQLERQIEQKISERLGGAGEIPADVVGEVSISDAEINEYIAQHPEELAPISSAHVTFTPGEVLADFRAYGTSGRARAGLAVENGRIVTVNPRIEGPLSLLLDAEQLSSSLEEQLNNQLSQGGKQITAVSVEQGLIIATVEQR